MKSKVITCITTALFFASCAQNTLTGDTYSRQDARRVQTVETGKIVGVRPVKIEGGNETGGLFGAIIGGFLGSLLGKGHTAHTVGAVGGAVAGGAAGSHIEQSMNSRAGVELTVLLDRGDSVAVVQEVNLREAFYVGDRVRVISGGTDSRVSH